MKVLLAFDVDGTLDCSDGPVPAASLAAYRAAGASVVIVSPSSARPSGFDRCLSASGDRLENLMIARRDFPADLRLYVSDNGDEATARAAGFTFVQPEHFI